MSSTRIKQRSAIAGRVLRVVLGSLIALFIGLAALAAWLFLSVDAALQDIPPAAQSWGAIQILIWERVLLVWPFVAGGALAFLLIVQMLIRWAIRPITQLAIAASAIGDQHDLALPVRATGEVGQIARSFNDLSSTLQTSLRTMHEQNRVMSDSVRRLEGVVQIGQELTPMLSSDEQLHRVVYTLRTTFGYERAGIAVVEGDHLTYYFSSAAEDATTAPTRARLTPESVAGYVEYNSALLYVRDFATEEGYAPSPGLPDVRSELAVPVRNDRDVLAVLLVQSSIANVFSAIDEQQLTTLAGLLVGALTSANQFQSEQLRRRLAEAIYRVSQTLSASVASERIPELILDQLALVLPYDRSALLMIQGDTAELTAMRGYGQQHIVSGGRIPLAQMPLVGAVVERGETLVVSDAQIDSRYRPMFGAAPARGWLGTPLMRQGNVDAVLVLESDKPGSYGEEQRHAIAAVATQASIALESARLYAATQEHNHRLEVIAGITNLISTRDVVRELPGVLRRIIHMMRRVVPCDYAAVALYHEEEDTFSLETVYDHSIRDWSKLPAGVRLVAIGTPWQTAIRTSGPLIQSNLEESPFSFDQQLLASDLRSSVVVPLIGQSCAFGALHFASSQFGAYSDVQIATLQELSQYLGPVLHNARLAREREETAVKLARTQEHLNLVDKVRTVGQLASGVAHDFNNLLGGVLGNAQLLLMEIEDDEQRDMLRVIERAAKDGTETVRRLQGFARMEHDSPMIEVRLDMLARDAIDITRPRWRDVAHSRGVTIDILRQLDPVTPIAGRPAELREVLTNLIINAVDALPQGGTITITTGDDPATGDVLVRVTDDGIGMPPDVEARIFDPFFTTKGEQGTGIGLPVSLGIVQSHGGRIEVETTPGHGTSFVVRLPVRVAAYQRPGSQRRERDMVPGHILLVESEAMIRTPTVRLLQRWGHRVTEATGGVEALQMFSPNAYDVVISELGMPDMNGWELLSQVKQRDPDVPTVLLTGWGRQQSEAEARSRGADFVLEKPFDQDDLRDVLAEALAGTLDRERLRA